MTNLPHSGDTPVTAPPSGGDWVPVTTDGSWYWDGTRWVATIENPWPAPPPPPPAYHLVSPAPAPPGREPLWLTGVLFPFRVVGHAIAGILGTVLGCLTMFVVVCFLAALFGHVFGH